MKKKIAIVFLAAEACAALAGCSSNPKSAVATIGGEEVPLALANFSAQVKAVEYDTYYMPMFGDNMWTADPNNTGSTITDSVKQGTMDELEEFYLLDARKADYGVELTEAETAAINDAAAQFISDNSDEALDVMTADEETVAEFLRLETVKKKVRDAIVADVDRDVPDEDCAQKTFSYVRVSKTASTDDEDATDEEKDAAAKEKAEKILSGALEDGGDDSLKSVAEDNDASALVCSYGDADLDEEDNSTSMDLEVLQAADKLKEGEFARNVLETDDAYYVIRMDSLFDEDATERERQSIISDREDERYEEVLEGFKEDSDWTVNEKVWEPVNFDTIFAKLQEQAGQTQGGAVDEGVDADGGDDGVDGDTDGDADSGTDSNTDSDADGAAGQQ